ncbi:MAG: hypothetical protein AAF703_23060 [Cyanobacteria bacterium P01_D01_bin.105]
MKKRYQKLGLIAVGVALLVMGFNALMTAIEIDVERGLVMSQPKAELVFHRLVTKVTKVTKGNDGIDRMRCIPNGHSDARAMGEVYGEHGFYQIWWYQENDGRFYQEVSLMFGESCAVVYGEQFDAAITNRVPLDVARALTVQFYQVIAEGFGGIEIYREHMTSSSSDDIEVENSADLPVPGGETEVLPEITSVDLWALQELGIILPPKTYSVLDIDDAWQYENSL